MASAHFCWVDVVGQSPADQVIRTSLAVLDEGRLAYLPATENWGAVKLVFDEVFGRVVVDQRAVDAEYLRGAQREIDALLQD